MENMHNLNEAISKANLAVFATSEDHLDQRICLNNLGAMLSDWYSQTWDMYHLDKAILGLKLVVSTTPKTIPIEEHS